MDGWNGFQWVSEWICRGFNGARLSSVWLVSPKELDGRFMEEDRARYGHGSSKILERYSTASRPMAVERRNGAVKKERKKKKARKEQKKNGSSGRISVRSDLIQLTQFKEAF